MSTQTRKLAAILFADIEGYTALMQTNEQLALASLQKFKQTLDTQVPTHHGEIIQYYGDGCLAIFNSSVDATACAKSLQEAFQRKPKVPVRIGLHAGDVVLRDGNVFGDAVNIASRIESMGVVGSVLLSSTVKNQIKNQSQFDVSPLGRFEFKNVEGTMTVYALTNNGLVVPEGEKLEGKFKATTTQKEGFLQNLWNSKVPQLLIAYLLLVWLSVQLIDWLLSQNGISPHWTQIFLISSLGLVPSLLVYFNSRERIRQKGLNKKEKLLFPTNFLILGAVLFFMFRTADLGATTKNITFVNADGEKETHTIVKEEFKIPVPIFPAESIKEDTIHTYLGLAFPNALSYKLSLNSYVSPIPFRLPISRIGSDFALTEKKNMTKTFNSDFFVDGKYQVLQDQYEFIPAIRNKKTGKVMHEKRFIGKDISTVIDSVCIYICEAIGLTAEQIEGAMDLPYKEFTSDNPEAIQAFLKGTTMGDFRHNMEKAFEIDSNFVLPMVLYNDDLNHFSSGQMEAKIVIDRAMKLRKKLPFQNQIRVMLQKHITYEEWDKAEQLLKIQLEIEPNNELYNSWLAQVYATTGQIDKLVAHAQRRFSKDPSPSNGFTAMIALLINGEPKKVIRRVNTFLLLDPQNVYALELLAQAYILDGNLDEATATLKKIILINPEIESFINLTLESVAHMKKHPITSKYLSKYEGIYRAGSSEQEWTYRILGGQLFGKPFGQRGYHRFPAGNNIFKTGKTYGGDVAEFLVNESGQIYGVKRIQIRPNREPVFYLWKQDSLIWKAEELLRKGDYENAKAAYERAMEQHPDQYYLAQAFEHLKHLSSHTEEEVKRNFQQIVGEYGDAKIWIENNLLYYKRPGLPRRILRPLSDDKFCTLLNYGWIYQIEKQNGEIVGISGYNYDPEKKEWVKDQDWFLDRTRLLD